MISTGGYDFTTKRFGMWVFLSMEGLFFGAIFFLYTAERFFFPEAFTLGSHHLVTTLASWNTGVLLTSSLTMALAVHHARENPRRGLFITFLILTAILGLTFIGLKGLEYSIDYRDALLPGFNFAPKFAAPPEISLFFSLYLFATFIHAIHLSIGVGWALSIAIGAAKKPAAQTWALRTDVLGLYWHFVDIVWIFLFPLFYLIGGPR